MPVVPSFPKLCNEDKGEEDEERTQCSSKPADATTGPEADATTGLDCSEYAEAQKALEDHCQARSKGKLKAVPLAVDEVVAMPMIPEDEFDRELEDEARLLEVALDQMYNCTQTCHDKNVQTGKKNPSTNPKGGSLTKKQKGKADPRFCPPGWTFPTSRIYLLW